ncbi:DNA-dependent ATPase MGS1 [Paracoccidioides lutzii Pb01]|uniref:DNA-dependent ATPase MGS1 n=1 Tax=Paracoccidioides lutzii (strain ATCC MYA-826 / Pb01) TaxID=502779 RepID=C1GVV0_PARBA|nr:DNA-dependent ATPase MGS1 [Paracoccidioides lutzii Pb01]EEH40669.2 DNA-dependent ATPase MGS1 [Paracoccidioides lutzii Pb01]
MAPDWLELLELVVAASSPMKLDSAILHYASGYSLAVVSMVRCPICDKSVRENKINDHIDSDCQSFITDAGSGQTTDRSSQGNHPVSSFFQNSSRKAVPQPISNINSQTSSPTPVPTSGPTQLPTLKGKRSFIDQDGLQRDFSGPGDAIPSLLGEGGGRSAKRSRVSNALRNAAPLAERMRPQTLDDVCGQELVGPSGVLRGLIEQDRVPSMVLWGGAGTGKTTIARVIAKMVGSRFVEINSTNSGVAECKKLFAEARNELSLSGKKTILFCDEIHRFSKSQQDVFLSPVESGQITLIGTTTENPSFKVQNALLSRCRTFTLAKLTDQDIIMILNRALEVEGPNYSPSSLVDDELIKYLAAFADGDARTSLNLLELAMDLSRREGMTKDELKKSLTRTLVYDRAGDQHYDTISAFHKSIRGSDPDAALYYLARMIQSGEDPLYIARRLIVVASEDIGLADNTMLSLATAAYTAVEKIGMPEARINLAHATVAMALSRKSTRAYRGLSNAMAVLEEPGMAGLPIPIHLRNAPTRLMKEMGYGKEYKYNPNYVDGKVAQVYLPEKLQGKQFLEDRDLGLQVDSDLHSDFERVGD